MQEEKEHKGLFGLVRSFIIEDVPAEGGPPAPDRKEASSSGAAGGDSVDKMFADIEAESGTKSRPGGSESALNPAPVAATLDAIPPDVRKVVGIIDALPAVLTREQAVPLLSATMAAANLDPVDISRQTAESRGGAVTGITAANQEIARLEAEREETLARLTRLMEAARAQCAEGVAAQQARIAELTAALDTLSRVATFLPEAPAADRTEKRS